MHYVLGKADFLRTVVVKREPDIIHLLLVTTVKLHESSSAQTAGRVKAERQE